MTNGRFALLFCKKKQWLVPIIFKYSYSDSESHQAAMARITKYTTAHLDRQQTVWSQGWWSCCKTGRSQWSRGRRYLCFHISLLLKQKVTWIRQHRPCLSCSNPGCSRRGQGWHGWSWLEVGIRNHFENDSMVIIKCLFSGICILLLRASDRVNYI